MSKLSLFYLGQGFSFVYFWIAIAVPFLSSRDLSPSSIFQLMAIYQLLGVFLEYPTGMFGDRYGYRKGVYIGNILGFISMITFIYGQSYLHYLIGMVVLAVASGFGSGNDMGMLKAISSNIKKDTANYLVVSDLVLFFSAIAGGYVSQLYSYETALFISAFCILFANFPLYLLKDSVHHSNTTMSFTTIFKDGMKTLRLPKIRQIFLLILVFSGFSYTIKTIFGGFGEQYNISVSNIGILVGIGSLVSAVGSKVYTFFEESKPLLAYILIALSLLLIGMTSNIGLIIGLFLAVRFFLSFISTKIDADLQTLVKDHVRSSIFSLKRVSIRLVSASYLFIYGLALEHNLFSFLMLLTSLIFFSVIWVTSNYQTE